MEGGYPNYPNSRGFPPAIQPFSQSPRSLNTLQLQAGDQQQQEDPLSVSQIGLSTINEHANSLPAPMLQNGSIQTHDGNPGYYTYDKTGQLWFVPIGTYQEPPMAALSTYSGSGMTRSTSNPTLAASPSLFSVAPPMARSYNQEHQRIVPYVASPQGKRAFLDQQHHQQRVQQQYQQPTSATSLYVSPYTSAIKHDSAGHHNISRALHSGSPSQEFQLQSSMQDMTSQMPPKLPSVKSKRKSTSGRGRELTETKPNQQQIVGPYLHNSEYYQYSPQVYTQNLHQPQAGLYTQPGPHLQQGHPFYGYPQIPPTPATASTHCPIPSARPREQSLVQMADSKQFYHMSLAQDYPQQNAIRTAFQSSSTYSPNAFAYQHGETEDDEADGDQEDVKQEDDRQHATLPVSPPAISRKPSVDSLGRSAAHSRSPEIDDVDKDEDWTASTKKGKKAKKMSVTKKQVSKRSGAKNKSKDWGRMTSESLRGQVVHTEPVLINGLLFTDAADAKTTDKLKRMCFTCRGIDPPSWRRSTLYMEKILCNRCGIFERAHGKPRPTDPAQLGYPPLPEKSRAGKQNGRKPPPKRMRTPRQRPDTVPGDTPPSQAQEQLAMTAPTTPEAHSKQRRESFESDREWTKKSTPEFPGRIANFNVCALQLPLSPTPLNLLARHLRAPPSLPPFAPLRLKTPRKCPRCWTMVKRPKSMPSVLLKHLPTSLDPDEELRQCMSDRSFSFSFSSTPTPSFILSHPQHVATVLFLLFISFLPITPAFTRILCKPIKRFMTSSQSR